MGRSRRPCGLMDKALVLGTKDCRFESCQSFLCCAWRGRRACEPAISCGAPALVARMWFMAASRSGRLLRPNDTLQCGGSRNVRVKLMSGTMRFSCFENLACQAELCFGFAQQRAQLGMPHAVRAWGAWLRLDGLVVSVECRRLRAHCVRGVVGLPVPASGAAWRLAATQLAAMQFEQCVRFTFLVKRRRAGAGGA